MTKVTDYQIDGTFVIRDMDAAELAQLKAQKDAGLLAKAQAEANAILKASAISKLIAGTPLNADEAKLLIG